MKKMKSIVLIAFIAHVTAQGAAAAELARPCRVAAGTAAATPIYDDEITNNMWGFIHYIVNWGDNGGSNAKALREILATGKANPNARGKYLYEPTPLSKATGSGNLILIKLLLEFRADPSQPSYTLSSATPLHKIACARYVSDFDEANCHNASDRHDMEQMRNRYNNSAAIINALLERHNNIIDMRDFNGDTPLLLAIRSINLNAVHALINHGAEISIPNIFGEDAKTMALASRTAASRAVKFKLGQYYCIDSYKRAQGIINELHAYIPNLQRRQIRKAAVAETIPGMPTEIAGLIAEYVE